MAASASMSPAQAELVNSLTQDDIPAKLRCAICSKLAVNAFRLPCCEQAICESCQSSLPSSCPVCEHSPLSADDCKPHKALRTTIKVFLRTEEKKREANRPKVSTHTTPVEADVTPRPPTSTAGGPPTNVPEGAGKQLEDPALPAVGSAEEDETSVERPAGVEQGTNDGAVDEPSNKATNVGGAMNMELATRQETTEPAGAETSRDRYEANAADETGEGQQQGSDLGQGFGFGGTNGPFPNINVGNGNFDQMQMMMAMQGGMPNSGFGAFPMMGMPGMGMDPAALQSMYINGGFGTQGLGMSGMNMSGMNMNMNMGMGGYGGGPNNNWDGQQSWNVGQDNFNHPSAPGMGNGDYGSFNSGFQTGFNQGNYGPANQFNDYRRNQHGFRGRGRGRGYGGYGYGRGGYNQGYGGHANLQDPGQMGQQFPAGMDNQAADVPGAPAENGTGAAGGAGDVDEFGRESRPRAEDGGAEGGDAAADGSTAPPPSDAAISRDHDDSPHAAGASSGDTYPQQQSASDAGMPIPSAGHTQGGGGSTIPVVPSPNPDVPLNAPKGPKALLRGLPNTSYRHLQARGLVRDDGPRANATGLPSPRIDDGHSRSASREPQRGATSDYRERSAEERTRDLRDRDHDRRARPRSQPPSRSRSRSPDGEKTRRRRRHRSASPSSDERNDERRRRRHRRKHSAHSDRNEHVDPKPLPRDEKLGDRLRSASPSESKRSSRRSSRRERGPERRREREKDRGRDRDHDRHREHKPSRRSHRDRAHERRDRDRGEDREHDKEKEKEKERGRRERHHDREREHRRRSSRRSPDEPPTPDESPDQEAKPSTEAEAAGGAAPPPGRGGLEIRGASSRLREPAEPGGRRSSHASAADAHAAERAARDRERLLRETRRMASLAGGDLVAAGVKRGRDEGGDRDGRRSRRRGRRGEVVGADDKEARMRRLEEERESARFRDG